MNREAVKTEIQNIITAIHTRNGVFHKYDRQYKVGKAQLATLTELGIIDLMPEGFGHSDAKAVIEAAQDAGKWVGDFDDTAKTSASKLYTLLNETTVVDLAAEQTTVVVVSNQPSPIVAFLFSINWTR